MLGLRIDADGPSQPRALGLGEVDDVLEGRDLILAVMRLVAIGEGERLVQDLVRTLQAGGEPRALPGIASLAADGTLQKNGRADRSSSSISSILSVRELPWAVNQRDGEAPLSQLLRDPQLLFRDLVSGGISALVWLLLSAGLASSSRLHRHQRMTVFLILLSAF